jgi:hypothetical protein
MFARKLLRDEENDDDGCGFMFSFYVFALRYLANGALAT